MLQGGLHSSITLLVASANVGTDGAGCRAASRASRFSEKESRLSVTAERMEAASVLAWAKLTAGYEPEPMSRVIEISWDEVKQ